MSFGKTLFCRRGEVVFLELEKGVGSEQGGNRFGIIIQNDIGNRSSPTTIVALVTSQVNKSKMPTHVRVEAEVCGLHKDSIILLEQVRTIDKKRIIGHRGRLSELQMKKVDKALIASITNKSKKTTLEKLEGEVKSCVLNKLELIDACTIYLKVFDNTAMDINSIKLAKSRKLEEESSLAYYCMQNNLDYATIIDNYESLKEDRVKNIVAFG